MRTVIYARISRDSAGFGLGVARQEADCRALCKRQGWTVADVLVENDVSAYGRRRRPLYEQLLDGLEQDRFDAIVAWHPDRLHRHPKELERFIDVVEKAGAHVATVQGGQYDLSTASGRMSARIVGAVARGESEHRSERLRRKHQEIAENGRLSGGGRRPFGYEADRRTIRRSEAKEITTAARRLLAGESIRAIAQDWQRRGVKTVTGAVWSPTTVKRLMMSGRISGQREHHGRIVGKADWPAIVTPDDTLRLRAVLSDPERATGPGAAAVREYLLTGWLHCGGCGARMTSRPVYRKGIRYRRYVCSADRGGCGRCGIGAEPLEALIAEAVLQRLDTPKLAREVRRRAKSKRGADVSDVAVLERRLTELAEMYAAGEVSRAELRIAREAINERITAARRAVTEDVEAHAAADLTGRGATVRAAWPTMSLDRKRAVVGAIVERIDIARTTKATNFFDAARVDVLWRA
jgi:site-specific DNA recombinase